MAQPFGAIGFGAFGAAAAGAGATGGTGAATAGAGATGGLGAPNAATTAGFGAPASVAYGAPAIGAGGGFGAPAAGAAGALGAPASGAAGGFVASAAAAAPTAGAPAGTTGGFGVAAGSSGFGTSGGGTSGFAAPTATGTASFGAPSTTAATSAAATSGAAATSAATAVSEADSKKKIAEEFAGKTLGQIVEKWERRLEEDLKMFQKKAMFIQQRDMELLKVGVEMRKLQEDVNRQHEQHRQMNQQINYIQAGQDQLERQLAELEKRDVGREGAGSETAYSSVLAMNEELNRLELMLKETYKKINNQNSAQADRSPAQEILEILNSQFDAIEGIEAQTMELNLKVDTIARQQQ